MSSRQKLKTTNDIFDMISENDEDIKFDECGILKIVTQSKATFVIVCVIKFVDNNVLIYICFLVK
jgi:hypothetical protein